MAVACIFIDRKPYDKSHQNVRIGPVLLKEMDEAVKERARALCPTEGRLGWLPHGNYIRWEERDVDRMSMSFFRFSGNIREMPGYREWIRADEVWARVDGKNLRMYSYVEQEYEQPQPGTPS